MIEAYHIIYTDNHGEHEVIISVESVDTFVDKLRDIKHAMIEHSEIVTIH